MTSNWKSQSSTMAQDDFIGSLADQVLGRPLASRDLHAAYEHAGVTRAPKLLPANLTGLQASRIIDWLLHLRAERRQEWRKVTVEDDLCIYCLAGCEFCDYAV